MLRQHKHASTVSTYTHSYRTSISLLIFPAEESLASALGFFGGAHTDENDSAAGFSCMTVLSDLPDGEGWEPGRFHLLTLGVFVTLEPFMVVFFTGRLRHGGTAPLQPPEDAKPLPPWAYRLTAIGYPSRRIVEGDVRHALAALPHRTEPLYLTQEMTGVKCVIILPVLHRYRNLSTHKRII